MHSVFVHGRCIFVECSIGFLDKSFICGCSVPHSSLVLFYKVLPNRLTCKGAAPCYNIILLPDY